MTNNKYFALFLALIIASIAINIVYSHASSGAINDTTAEDWSNDVSLIAFKASEYWRTPSVLGGGSDNFSGLDKIELLGIDQALLSAEYQITSVKETEFTLISREVIPGSLVKTTITYEGIATLPTIIEL
ncbi:MAG: hypothetical protein IIC39_07135 [Candidatus Marinimicrobia bacterium]|nr:hypothetical protein [Candidatus Neomarinimicrobiota bacterium]TFB11222.1 hypothetical protein E3V36_01675 [Candidatus Marinimicrobia bacterium MT.SAG.2]